MLHSPLNTVFISHANKLSPELFISITNWWFLPSKIHSLPSARQFKITLTKELKRKAHLFTHTVHLCPCTAYSSSLSHLCFSILLLLFLLASCRDCSIREAPAPARAVVMADILGLGDLLPREFSSKRVKLADWLADVVTYSHWQQVYTEIHITHCCLCWRTVTFLVMCQGIIRWWLLCLTELTKYSIIHIVCIFVTPHIPTNIHYISILNISVMVAGALRPGEGSQGAHRRMRLCRVLDSSCRSRSLWAKKA